MDDLDRALELADAAAGFGGRDLKTAIGGRAVKAVQLGRPRWGGATAR